MRIRLKKITAFILLLPALAPVLYILVFHIHQYSIRLEMKQQLIDQTLQTISLPAGDLHWARDGKEIIVYGKMFDVKAVDYKSDGTVLLTGLYDADESRLINLLQQKQEKEDNAATNHQLTKLLQLVLDLPATQLQENDNYLFDARTGFSLNDMALSSAFKNILTPPPQA